MEVRVGINRDFQTLADALAAFPYEEEAHIYLDAGVYREKVFLEKRQVTITGAGMGKTVISFGDGAYEILADGEKRGTFQSYTFFAGGEKVTLKDLTIENTAGEGCKAGQAVAVYADAAYVYMENVELLAHQDTLFLAPLPKEEREKRGFKGPRENAERKLTRQYYHHCRIKGDVDFIFGGADALFEGCEIIAGRRSEVSPDGTLNGNASGNGSENREDIKLCKPIINAYVTAPCESSGSLGFIFQDCVIHGDTGVEDGSVFLGRPWRPQGKTVYINCKFDASVHPKRFAGWGSIEEDCPEAYFAEYGSKRLTGEPVDMSGKNPWVRELGEAEAAEIAGRAAQLRAVLAI